MPSSVIAAIVVVLILVLLAASSLRVVREYERVVAFRLGRLRGPLGPGIVVMLPFLVAKQFFDHSISRKYIALVWGDIVQDGTITAHRPQPDRRWDRAPRDRRLSLPLRHSPRGYGADRAP